MFAAAKPASARPSPIGQGCGYYNAFTDGSGAPLNGSVVPAYRLTFTKKEIPQASRFWSLTAYLPRGNTLVPNASALARSVRSIQAGWPCDRACKAPAGYLPGSCRR